MNPDFLPYLADPVSKEPLTLEGGRRDGGRVIEGRLVSDLAVYPITNGIPRFATAADYVGSFAEQWARWRRIQFDGENIGRPMEGYTRRMWESITGCGDVLDGTVVGDFGCGAGRFVETVRAKGGRVIALELSGAVDVAAANFRDDPGVLVCQADVMMPPIRPGALDGAFSIGVLHHTPRPGNGVAAMAGAVKPGGWVALSVYPRHGYYDSTRVRMGRLVFRTLAAGFGLRPLLLYAQATARLWRAVAGVPRLAALFRRVLPFVGLPDVDWSALDTFDSLAPWHQSTHGEVEVRAWLESCGLAQVRRAGWGATSYRGVRPLDVRIVTQ